MRWLAILPYLVVSTFYFIKPSFTFAQELKFAVTEEIIYQVRDNGNTSVTQNFTFTNLTSDFFPQEYVFTTGNGKISNLRGLDRLGPLALETQNLGSQNKIHVKFNDPVVGLGKILRWSFFFDQNDIAQKNGDLWNIFIPPYTKVPGLTDLAIRLNLPTGFGRNVFVKPKPNANDFFWNLDQIDAEPIVAVFDPQNLPLPVQSYDFKLRYQLYNSRLYPVTMQIALPPDTPSQKIYLNQLTPKPTDVTLDDNGNWLASFQLGPIARLEVTATGSADLFLSAQKETPINDPSHFLQPEKYWATKDEQITKIAQKQAQPKQIYNLTLGALSPISGSNKPSRLGARNSLLAAKGTAADFSDLFITLSRAAQIPAREVNGYLIGTQPQVHIWPEYFDTAQNKWVMVDPYLAKIENGLDNFDVLDFRHFVFAVRSGDFAASLPDNVTITPQPRSSLSRPKPNISAGAFLPTKITAGFDTPGRLFVENHGPTLFSNQSISLRASNLTVNPQIFLTGDIPPFGHQDFNFSLRFPSPTSSTDDIISLQFGSEKQDYPIKVQPLYKNVYLLVLGGLIFFGTLSLIAQISRGLHFSRFKRKSPLRGQSKEPA